MKFYSIIQIIIIFSTQFTFGADPDPNVILLMLDGVRWQEVFHGTDPELDEGQSEPVIFKYLFHELLNNGFIGGDRQTGHPMMVSNSYNISLPAYQSIMAGSPQPCRTNICGRINVETLGERIQRELHLPKEQVATIASWETISDAAEHTKGQTFVNVGIEALNDGDVSPTTVELNRMQKKDTPPWGSARFDKYTFQHAMNYLKKHQPRFMFISLNDSDEWGHKGEYRKYINTLHQYDEWIETLFTTLDQMGSYGKSTSIIITTDHGRGNGSSWKNHGLIYSDSKYIWLYGKNSRSSSPKGLLSQEYTHNDLRPTIEALLKLDPIKCSKCGNVIRELVE